MPVELATTATSAPPGWRDRSFQPRERPRLLVFRARPLGRSRFSGLHAESRMPCRATHPALTRFCASFRGEATWSAAGGTGSPHWDCFQ